MKIITKLTIALVGASMMAAPAIVDAQEDAPKKKKIRKAVEEAGEKKVEDAKEELVDVAEDPSVPLSDRKRIKVLRKELSAENTVEGWLIEVPGDILFEVDKAKVRSQAEDSLRDIAELVELSGEPWVTVEGHTDSRESEEYNLDLSARRAAAVKKWLVTEGNLKPSKITTAGLGESEPVATNETAAGRQLNRRVEIVLRHQDQKVTS